jgi:hypothetical protein
MKNKTKIFNISESLDTGSFERNTKAVKTGQRE